MNVIKQVIYGVAIGLAVAAVMGYWLSSLS